MNKINLRKEVEDIRESVLGSFMIIDYFALMQIILTNPINFSLFLNKEILIKVCQHRKIKKPEKETICMIRYNLQSQLRGTLYTFFTNGYTLPQPYIQGWEHSWTETTATR